MKSIVSPGDKVRAACEHCGRFQSATFAYGGFTLSDGTTVPNVMRATCDKCGDIVALAQQSAHAIKAHRDLHRAKRTSVRLPRPLYDFAASEVSQVGGDPKNSITLLLKAFFASLLNDEQRRERMILQLRDLDDPILHQRADVSINLHLASQLMEEAERLRTASRLKSTSEVFRKALVASEGDPLVEIHLKKLLVTQ
jgi:hypothetical protein